MNQRIIFAIFFSVFFLSNIIASKPKANNWINIAINRCEVQLLATAEKYKDSLKCPRTFENGKIRLVNAKDWTSGFFPGSLWYMFELTNNAKFKTEAERFTGFLESAQYRTNTHDLGFIIQCSYGNGYRITGNEGYKKVMLNGAKSLMTRFHPEIGLVKSWDKTNWQYPVIIDNMLNLEYLFEVSKISGDKVLKEAAISHANKTMLHHFRIDNSCFHVVNYDSITGQVINRQTHQGYNDGSSWARGQAWALYGYTMMYRETKDPKYLLQAQKVAAFILNHPNLPTDKIPYWDFDAPKIPNEPRDASAAAVIASALIELSNFDSNLVYIKSAEMMLKSLSSTDYLAGKGENGLFILKHSTGSKPANSEVDVPLSYADYYYIEALGRYLKATQNAQKIWQSALLKVSKNGSLKYNKDNQGFVLPNFSHAGYKGGGVELPEVATVKTISPIEGDNTKHIQEALDAIGAMPKNQVGIRGALLLNAGKYNISGTVYLKYDGVVLRGVGQGADSTTSTILYAIGNLPEKRDVVVLGNPTKFVAGIKQISGSKRYITDEKVEVGSNSFHVDNADIYRVGDRIIIYHPCTQTWVDAVDKGGVLFPDPLAPNDPDERWAVNQLPIVYNRYVTAVEGNKISIDAPVFYDLTKSLSNSYIYKPNMDGLVYDVGLENLRIDIETKGGTDENHAWSAASYKSCENAWAKNCTFIHFAYSGIVTEACTRSTFTYCTAINPVGIVTGGRMYNFNNSAHSQLILFSNCFANNGRHHYVSNGTSTASGNVVLRSFSEGSRMVNEGHRQWTQGMLYDNLKETKLRRDFVIGFYNRINAGTGHGWSAVHSVLWNCDIDSTRAIIGLQQPPTAQNYAIGCFAKTIGGTIYGKTLPSGYVEGQNKSGLFPASLYEAQLHARLKNKKISKQNK